MPTFPEWVPAPPDWATALMTRWSLDTSIDVTRYVVFAVGVWLLMWVVFRKPLKGRKIRQETPPARQLVTEFFISVRSIAIFSTVGLSLFILERSGLLPGPATAAGWGPAWFWTSLVLMIVAHDAYFYWAHRVMHRPGLFRIFHRRHHKSHNPSPFTAYSFDLGEAAVMASFVPLWMVLVPTPWPVVGLFMLHQIVRNTLGHSGYEVMPARADGRPLLPLLTTVTHHDLHHAEAGYNYGLYFTWWDRWMGTEHPEYLARYAAAVRKTLKDPTKGRTPAPPVVRTLVLATAAAIALQALQPAHAETPASISGDWATPGLGAVVRLHACADSPDQLCGRLSWAWDPSELKPGSVGEPMLSAFVWEKSRWTGGKLRNPEDGRVYSGSITPDGDRLHLKGCAGPFCQTQTWRRLSSIPRPDA
jgi:Delta7-sterol 5-desaturase